MNIVSNQRTFQCEKKKWQTHKI